MTHRSRLVALAALLVVVAWLVPVTTAAAGGGQPSGSSSEPPTTAEPPESPSIIPRPNSGSPPDDAGDRGGALQTALFVAILVAVVGAGAYVVRQSRRARDDRGF